MSDREYLRNVGGNGRVSRKRPKLQRMVRFAQRTFFPPQGSVDLRNIGTGLAFPLGQFLRIVGQPVLKSRPGGFEVAARPFILALHTSDSPECLEFSASSVPVRSSFWQNVMGSGHFFDR